MGTSKKPTGHCGPERDSGDACGPSAEAASHSFAEVAILVKTSRGAKQREMVRRSHTEVSARCVPATGWP